jgi:exopolyphosphatase / guanosine-5'-triphosphate,3'-diphosphate pyrophosphatase
VNAHIDISDDDLVVVIDEVRTSLPIGIVTIADDLVTDPPRPEEFTNAIGLVADHIDDVVRDHPDLIGAEVSMSSPEVTAMVAVELGRSASLPFVFERAAAEDVFRTLATERRIDRAKNPGLDPLLIDRVVAGSCVVVAVMRKLQLESVMVTS